MNHFDPDLGLGNVTVKCNFNDSMVAVIEFRPLGHQAHSLSRFLIGWIPTTKRLLTLNLGAVWEIDLSINKNTIKPLKTHNSLSKILILANLAGPYSLKNLSSLNIWPQWPYVDLLTAFKL